LVGAPEGRSEALLTALLRDRNQVLRFLLLLLADSSGSADSALSALAGFRENAGADDSWRQPPVPLLETMLRALDRDPQALEQVERLIADLSASDAGSDLLPEGFLDVWQPIRDAMAAS
jgi:hypothetical protein